VYFPDPAGGFGKMITVMVEMNAGGLADGLDAVAVEIKD
jgi:hypothetical protein